jgi:CRP-like cAMP-binding protein
VQAYKIAQAIMRMAQQQIILESRVDDHEQRIEQLESLAGNVKHHINPSQASQISQAVKAIAMELQKLSRRNEYGGVYGEFYRRFEVTSYKQLPKNRFDEAMIFLNGWYAQITGNDDVPF